MLRFLAPVALASGLLLAVAIDVSASESSPAKLAVGEKAPDFAFTDIRYLPRKFGELGNAKTTVVVFTTLDCPIVGRYLPVLKALDDKYRPRGVQFLALNVGPDDAVMEVAYQAVKADWAFPVGKDFDGAAARALGAKRAPEVVVLDAERKLRYRGRIDAQVRLGGQAAGEVRDDLAEAIEDVLAGHDVRVAETPTDGCLIEYDALSALPDRAPKDVNYSEHVAPLMAKHCQDCHHPGTTAPFSLLTFRDALSHAETIAEVVRQERMPPAFASKSHGEFVNRRAMTPKERATILAWAAASKPEGDPAKLPVPRVFPEVKWKIGEPDLVLRSAEFKVPAEGLVKYHYAMLPYVFLHDTWLQKVEILPGNKRAVHHCNMAFVTVGGVNDTRNFITGYVPGGDPMVLDNHLGFMIPAGSMLMLEIHYVTSGEASSDRTEVGLVYAKERIDQQLRHFQCVNRRFAIPPQAAHHPVSAVRTFQGPATGIGMFTHMHLRGKDMTFKAQYPDGREEILLAVPNYNFDWQISYRWPSDKIKFPKGTKIEVTAHYDNSPFNPYNPDPSDTVREGQQTHQEMMYGFLFYTNDEEKLGLEIDPKSGQAVDGKKAKGG